VSHLHYKGELDRIDALDRELAALAPEADAAALGALVVAEREAAFRKSEEDKDRRMTAAIVTGAVYAASLLDALISSPSERPVESGPRIGFVAPTGGRSVRSASPSEGRRRRAGPFGRRGMKMNRLTRAALFQPCLFSSAAAGNPTDPGALDAPRPLDLVAEWRKSCLPPLGRIERTASTIASIDEDGCKRLRSDRGDPT
jgi:hypothetical protein